MIKPIDMQIMVKNVDEVAKLNKGQEQSLAGQQLNAQKDLEQETEMQMNTIAETNESEKKGIDKDEKKEQQKRYLLKKKKEKEEKHKEQHHSNEPFKGNKLDLEG